MKESIHLTGNEYNILVTVLSVGCTSQMQSSIGGTQLTLFRHRRTSATRAGHPKGCSSHMVSAHDFGLGLAYHGVRRLQ